MARPRQFKLAGKIFTLICITVVLTAAACLQIKDKKADSSPPPSAKYVDNFNDGCLSVNLIGGLVNAEINFPSELFLSAEKGSAEDSKGYCLKLKYKLNKNLPAILIIGLNELDVSAARNLDFWIKGVYNSLIMNLELKDGKGSVSSVKLNNYLKIEKGWQGVSIPLADFKDINLNNLAEFSLMLETETDFQDGEILLDDIAFSGAPGVFFKSLKDNLYDFPKIKLIPRRNLLNKSDTELIDTLARDSWLYFKNLVDKNTHLPVDWIDLDKTKEYRIGDYTSPTNIGLYFLSIVGAYDLGFIAREEALSRIQDTLNVIKDLPRWKGLWHNWYSTTNLQVTRRYISSVDNGWLAAGLIVISQAFPEDFGSICNRLLEEMDFSQVYDPVVGQLFIGVELNTLPPKPTPYHYGLIATEPRVASLIAIGKGDVPQEHWFRILRTLPRAWDWQTQIPKGQYQEYMGIDVFEGYYTYNELHIVPSWGGSLFEFLMPTLVVKEKELARRSLGANNINAVKAHIHYALKEKGYPIWGISPCSTPDGKYGGYSEFGVAKIGAKGYKDEGIITPHASILAIDCFPQEVIKNIRAMIKYFDIYGEYGLYDSVDVLKRKVSYRYMCLDQGMLFVALANYLTGGKIRDRFHASPIIKKVEHLLMMEEFF